MDHFKVTVRRWGDASDKVEFQILDLEDHNGQSCGGMIDLLERYDSIQVLTDDLAEQLGVRPDQLQVIEKA